MSVLTTVISSQIQALQAEMAAKTYTVDETTGAVDATEIANAQVAYANGLADIIAAAVLSATITVPLGIPVLTAGGPTSQVGATTAASVAVVT
jgi:hypothetical protein